MNAHIVFGLFALYVAAVSLYLVLAGRQEPLLALLRRGWGRTRGYALYFLVHVALPMLVCVLCLGWGVRHYDAGVASEGFARPLHLHIESYRDFRLMMQKERAAEPNYVVYGA